AIGRHGHRHLRRDDDAPRIGRDAPADDVPMNLIGAGLLREQGGGHPAHDDYHQSTHTMHPRREAIPRSQIRYWNSCESNVSSITAERSMLSARLTFGARPPGLDRTDRSSEEPPIGDFQIVVALSRSGHYASSHDLDAPHASRAFPSP